MTSWENDPVAVVVNEEQVRLSDLLRSMRVTDDLSLFDRYARQRLVAQLARREGLRVDPEELQAGVDEWRYRNRLERAEDTEIWLTRRRLGLDEVAAEVEGRLLKEALADKVTKGRIEPYFAQHALDFDEAEVCWIHVAEEGIAEEIRMQVVEEGANFYDLARRCSDDGRTRPGGGYLGRLRRAQMPKGVAPLIFAATPGGVVGPVRVAKGHALYFVQQVYRATLGEGVKQEIRERLFGAWLMRETQKARIGFPTIEALLRSSEEREISSPTEECGDPST